MRVRHRERPRRPGAGLVQLTALAVLVLLAACGGPRPESEIGTGADGLRTFTVPESTDGVIHTCGLPAVAGVSGTLHGDPSDPERIWLESGSRRLSVVWPPGFTVRFEPDAVLYDERGVDVARHGEDVELGATAESVAGTFADPYISNCWMFGRIYPPFVGYGEE